MCFRNVFTTSFKPCGSTLKRADLEEFNINIKYLRGNFQNEFVYSSNYLGGKHFSSEIVPDMVQIIKGDNISFHPNLAPTDYTPSADYSSTNTVLVNLEIGENKMTEQTWATDINIASRTSDGSHYIDNNTQFYPLIVAFCDRSVGDLKVGKCSRPEKFREEIHWSNLLVYCAEQLVQ